MISKVGAIYPNFRGQHSIKLDSDQSKQRISKKMAGTAQQTKAAITLKGSTDIVAEFFRNYQLFNHLNTYRVL